MLTNLFATLVNMSIASSFVCVAVFLVRLILKRAPKIFSYAIWFFVLVRLLIPFSFSSSLSIFNAVNPSINQNGTVQFIDVPQRYSQPTLNLQQNTIDKTTLDMEESNQVLTPQKEDVIQPNLSNKESAQMNITIQQVLPLIWLGGTILFFIILITQDYKLRNKLRFAMKIENKVYECDEITVPFLYGIVSPKIYLPSELDEKQLQYVIHHEKVHLVRYDYLIKLLATILLALHWFNPILWIAYYLMSEDMEMSCDEAVIRSLGIENKRDYSRTLLQFAARPFSTALAFSESRTSSRIKHVLKYKKPQCWTVIIACLMLACLLVPLLTNPRPFGKDTQAIENAKQIAIEEKSESVPFFVSTLAELSNASLSFQLLSNNTILVQVNKGVDSDYILFDQKRMEMKAVLLSSAGLALTKKEAFAIGTAAKNVANDTILYDELWQKALQYNNQQSYILDTNFVFPEILEGEVQYIPVDQDRLLINLGQGSLVYDASLQKITYRTTRLSDLNLSEERLLDIAKLVQVYVDQNIFYSDFCAILENDVISCPSSNKKIPAEIATINPLIEPEILSAFSENQNFVTLKSMAKLDKIPVMAMKDSTVLEAGQDELGTYLLLQDAENITYYGGLDEDIWLLDNQSVVMGQIIGYLTSQEATLTVKTNNKEDNQVIDPLDNVRYQLLNGLKIQVREVVHYPYEITEEQFAQVEALVNETRAFEGYQNRKPFVEHTMLDRNQAIHDIMITAQTRDLATVSIIQKENEHQFFVDKNYIFNKDDDQWIDGYNVSLVVYVTPLLENSSDETNQFTISYSLNNAVTMYSGTYTARTKTLQDDPNTPNLPEQFQLALAEQLDAYCQTIVEVDKKVNGLVEQIIEIISNGEEIPVELKSFGDM